MTTAANAGFVHGPLSQPSDLRLVELRLSSEDDDVLAARLHVRDGPATEYAALSYVWGDPEDTVEIEVNERPFRITTNLHGALLRYRAELRRELGSRTAQWPALLWVDALSINQADPEEKSVQVSRMSAIYSGAQCVFAYLGPEADLSSVALSKIRTVVERYDALTGGIGSRDVPKWVPSLLADELMLCDDDDEDDGPIWEAVQAFYSRDWWSRIWIAQEASTSAETWVACGHEKMLLDDVLTFAVLVGIYEQEEGDAATRTYPIPPYVYSLEDLRAQRYAEGPESELLNMLMSCRHYEATDARDKVYGVLGMVAPRGASRLLPDYNKELVDIFTDVVQYHIGTSSYEDKLDFLGGDGLPEGGMTGLPSWLPDWRFRHQYHVPFRKFLENATLTPRPGQKGDGPWVFNASGTAEAVRRLGVVDTDRLAEIEGRSLRVRGYRVGYLYDIKPAFEPASQDAIDVWKTAVRDGLYFTGESELGAFNKLLVAGMVREGMDAVARTPVFDPDDPDDDDFPGGYGASGGPAAAPSVENILVACSGRRFGRVVQKDWNADGMALVPQSVREGDQVFVLLGGQVLYVLRPVGSAFRFVGECYVHGLMDGEVLDILGTGLAKIRDVVIR
jgi:hypothetical protein